MGTSLSSLHPCCIAKAFPFFPASTTSCWLSLSFLFQQLESCANVLIKIGKSLALGLRRVHEHPLISWSDLSIMSITWLTVPSCLPEGRGRGELQRWKGNRCAWRRARNLTFTEHPLKDFRKVSPKGATLAYWLFWVEGKWDHDWPVSTARQTSTY